MDLGNLNAVSQVLSLPITKCVSYRSSHKLEHFIVLGEILREKEKVQQAAGALRAEWAGSGALACSTDRRAELSSSGQTHLPVSLLSKEHQGHVPSSF